MTDFLNYDALGLAELVRTGAASPRELASAAIAQVEARNPRINAVVHPMFDAALRQADGPLPDGPFRGVPFMLKDLLAWYAGEPITSGSRYFMDFIAPHDTEIVRRYRASGVIVIGKTNTPEFGLVPFTEPDFLGICRNPWNPERTAGGSSGGSAAAVASGMVPMAGGGDGGGSIRIPASCCGVFGMKPTRARTPSGPDQGELWRGSVVEHVITRSVRDSAAMLDAIAGPDLGAPYVAPPQVGPYLAECALPPGRLRIAFSSKPMQGTSVHPDCVRAVTDAAHLLESLGHEVVEDTLPLDREAFNRCFLTVVCCETAAELIDAARFTGRAVRRQDVEVNTWAIALIGRSIAAPEYSDAVRQLQRMSRRVATFFERYPVFLTPVLAGPPFPHGELQPPPSERILLKAVGALRAPGLLRLLGALERAAGTVYEWMSYTPLANATGQPAMSVPLSWNAEGLPIGVQFMGRFGDEATLFRLAAQLEQAAPWFNRRPAT